MATHAPITGAQMCAPSKDLQRVFDRDIIFTELLGSADAILSAISTAGYLDVLPADEDAKTNHNRGLWLLSALRDQVDEARRRADAIDAERVL